MDVDGDLGGVVVGGTLAPCAGFGVGCELAVDFGDEPGEAGGIALPLIEVVRGGDGFIGEVDRGGFDIDVCERGDGVHVLCFGGADGGVGRHRGSGASVTCDRFGPKSRIEFEITNS